MIKEKLLNKNVKNNSEDVLAMQKLFSSKEFEAEYHYSGELGAIYTKEKTFFKLWAPTASKVQLNLYKEGIGGNAFEVIDAVKGDKGIWSVEKIGDLKGVFYTYSVTVEGTVNEAVDVYAKAVGVNGVRGMVVDLTETNPEKWQEDKGPELKNYTDAVLYEVHVRDISMDENSGIKMKGKFLGFTERGTTNSYGEATGLDHLVELGVTHIHILPMYDYGSIDETKLEENKYNWGYDPENYNAPEGSYSTDPYSGTVRINELKRMVQAIHNAGLGVIMDSVYNHTLKAEKSSFNKTVPGYYYRMKEDGSFAAGSACLNDTASERSMYRKYMVDAVYYWAKEYHIDGFRFDLMGLHDIDTMNAIRVQLDKLNPQIMMYGEAWDLAGSVLDEKIEATKVNVKYLDNRIAAFSDDMRDGIRGDVFISEIGGFVNYNGKWKAMPAERIKESVKFGIVASTEHKEIDYSKVNYSTAPWAKEPTQTVNYASCHDNQTLWDKIYSTSGDLSEEERIKMNKLSAGLVLTSQGIPFLMAGEEILKTKGGIHDSFKSPDSVNKMDWNRKHQYKDIFEYYKGLIALRKAHPAFRMTKTADIQRNLSFIETNDKSIAYTIANSANGDKWSQIVVMVNADVKEIEVTLPGKGWIAVVDGERAGIEELSEIDNNKVTVPARTMMVLVDKNSYNGKLK